MLEFEIDGPSSARKSASTYVNEAQIGFGYSRGINGTVRALIGTTRILADHIKISDFDALGPH